MITSRNAGRYNLHRLGWAAFEDLCIQLLREVLGETCSRFRPGPDEGRDGWFRGITGGKLLSQSKMEGNFVVQCKHTSKPTKSLTHSDLDNELPKLKRIGATSQFNYIIMTNRQVSAPNESAIREEFEKQKEIEQCLVLAETWIEDTIDAHPRLLRLVPRLYGIGDLSQILSFVIQQQTLALFEELAHSLQAFVPTAPYRKAVEALDKERLVFLVGPPASGKSAVAASLCMINIAEYGDTRILRIEDAHQFTETWSPSDTETIYWVDDVFGETTFDESKLREWSTVFDKVKASRKHKTRLIFCTRDYILATAEQKLKKAKAEIINDSKIKVDVTQLSIEERESILYNHIKVGNISRHQKSALKRYLPDLARLRSFSPELARRLGNRRFNSKDSYNLELLTDFFERPVQYFQDLIHGMADSEKAAIAVCLLNDNAVPVPIPDESLSDLVLKSYNVSMQQVRESFECLEGSIMKRVVYSTTQLWQVHHPSMIDALQNDLAQKPSKLTLYIQAANIEAILRDTTMLSSERGSHLVFLPGAVYHFLISRLKNSVRKSHYERLALYLVERASDEFLRALDQKHFEIMDRILQIEPIPGEKSIALRFAGRLLELGPGDSIGAKRRKLLTNSLAESESEDGWAEFLERDLIEIVGHDFVKSFLENEVHSDFSSLERLYDWYSSCVPATREHWNSAIESIEYQAKLLAAALATNNLESDSLTTKLEHKKSHIIDSIYSEIDIIDEEEWARADYDHDILKEQRAFENYIISESRFADVDK